MTRLRKSVHTSIKVFFVAILILCICVSGDCMTPRQHSGENHVLSYRDSIILEMAGFIQPGVRLSKSEKRHIESRIKKFPHRVVRRDTLSYFLNTAYAVAYYEFYRHDYKKARQWVDEFDKHGRKPGLIPSIFDYSSIGFSARNSLDAKSKVKRKKDKNSWLVISNHIPDSLKFDEKRTPSQFIDSFLDDMPLDCDISCYRKLLAIFKDGGGRLELLNGFTSPGFIQRCVDANRTDILDIILKLWDVSLADFKVGKYGFLEYRNKSLRVDSAAIAIFTDEILFWDPKRNRQQIDSLVANHNTSSIGNRVLSLLNVYNNNSKYTEVVNACERYNRYLEGPTLSTLHNYWGIALSNLGKYEEALGHFDTAIETSTNRDVISNMRLNKACALGEMGRTDEAISIFMSEKDYQKKPFDRFSWNDNLGYIYSFIDPTTALYYYNQAELFLDSSKMYEERKIRHFCRKARVLGSNKYLQRKSIDEALKFAITDFCLNIAQGIAYTELGCFNASVYDYEEADKNFSKAYKLLAGLAKEDRRIAYLNLNYANNLCNLYRYDEAAEILIKQLHTNEALFGPRSQKNTPILRELLSLVCKHPVSCISADDLYEQYKSISDCRAADSGNYDDMMVEINYGLYKNDWPKVKSLMAKAFDMELTSIQRLELCRTYEKACREYCTSIEYNREIQQLIPLIKTDVVSSLLLLTGNQKRVMQTPVSDIFDGSVSMNASEAALSLSLFRKGLLFATGRAVERKLANGRKTKQRYQTLVSLREELNSAIAYNDSAHIPQLASSISSLERDLSREIRSGKELFELIDKNLSMVTSALGASDLALDFVRYMHDNEAHYGTFAIDNGGLVKFIRLGTESELKSDPGKIWRFLRDGFSRYSSIYFSTDGLFNNIGIEYLDIEKGIPVSSVFNLHRVFHLSEIKKESYIGNDIVAVGVSDHNSPIGNGENIDRGAWTDLPNVKYEMQLITHTLESLEPRVLFNDDATEQHFKELSNSGITTLHISTHGFYRSSKMLEAAISNPHDHDYNIARRFLVSGRDQVAGLVLRQGNISWQSPEILDESDDLLTSEEIELMNFPDLRLTVLSACDTGLGDVDPEGVWGLQRAFRIAGTKSLICSLSKVDDYWTAQFMDAFYEQAVQGKTIYDSFHEAQRWLRHELPDNPEIWSSLILIE